MCFVLSVPLAPRRVFGRIYGFLFETFKYSDFTILRHMRVQLKTGLAPVLAALFLLLAGCNGGGGSTSDYNTGTNGVSLEFLPGSPPVCPQAIYHGDPSDVEMRLTNRGGTAASGTIHLSGFDTSIFDGLKKDYPFSGLASRSADLPSGGQRDIGDEFSLKLPSGVDSLPNVNIQADLCYSYKTEPSIQVCVDPDPADNEDDACTAGAKAGVSGGQAAPIAVTAVVMESSKSRTTFAFTVSNRGRGKPYLGSDCRNIAPENDESVRLTKAMISDRSFDECTPSIGSPIRLDGGSGTFTCRMANTRDTAYVTVVTLGFDYNYKETSSVTVCGKRA